MGETEISLLADTEFLLYESEDGEIRIETRLVNESIWLNHNQLAELFKIDLTKSQMDNY